MEFEFEFELELELGLELFPVELELELEVRASLPPFLKFLPRWLFVLEVEAEAGGVDIVWDLMGCKGGGWWLSVAIY